MTAPTSEPSHRRALISVSAIFLSVAFLVMGNGLQTMLLPLRGTMEAFDPVQIGLLGSGYFGGFVIGCLVTPRIIVRAGHIRTFAALVAIASASALGHPILIDPWVWILLRVITGFCLAGLYLVIESWINERATNETRGLLMSTYVGINFTVITLGQMMVTVLAPDSFKLFSLASILVSLAAVPIVLTRSPQPAPITLVRLRPARLYRISPAGVVGVFLIGVSNGAFWSLGPVFAQSASNSVTTAALFMSIAVIGGAALQWPVGRLSDKVDRRIVMIGLAASSSLFGLALLVYGALDGVGLMLGFLFGAGLLPAYAIATAHAYDFAARADLVETSSGLLLLNGLGSVIGPILAAALMSAQGPYALFIFNVAVQALLAAFVLWRLRLRQAPAEAEKEEFDIGATGQVVAIDDELGMIESDDVVFADPVTGELTSFEGTIERVDD